MKLKHFSPLAFLLLASSSYAADLTGNWLVKQESADGNIRETYYDLKQDGENITGMVRNNRDQKIQSGTIGADGKVTLVLQGQNNRPGGRVMAKFVNGELRVTMPGRNGAPSEEIVATRAPAGAGAPPARIEPPALHKVPYNGLAKTPPMGWNSWNKFAGA